MCVPNDANAACGFFHTENVNSSWMTQQKKKKKKKKFKISSIQAEEACIVMSMMKLIVKDKMCHLVTGMREIRCCSVGPMSWMPGHPINAQCWRGCVVCQ